MQKMNILFLARKEANETSHPARLASDGTMTTRKLEFFRGTTFAESMCSIYVDEETFERVKVGQTYEIKIEPVAPSTE